MIFLTGIDTNCHEAEIREYFNTYFQTSFKFRFLRSKTSKRIIFNGCRILTAPDQATASKVLKSGPYRYNNRQFFPKPYLKGNQLANQQESIKRRRVFIHNCLANFTNDMVQSIFEKVAPIEDAFLIHEGRRKNRRFKFGYVLFLYEEDARRMASVGFIRYNKRKILISAFREKGEVVGFGGDGLGRGGGPEMRFRGSDAGFGGRGGEDFGYERDGFGESRNLIGGHRDRLRGVGKDLRPYERNFDDFDYYQGYYQCEKNFDFQDDFEHYHGYEGDWDDEEDYEHEFGGYMDSETHISEDYYQERNHQKRTSYDPQPTQNEDRWHQRWETGPPDHPDYHDSREERYQTQHRHQSYWQDSDSIEDNYSERDQRSNRPPRTQHPREANTGYDPYPSQARLRIQREGGRGSHSKHLLTGPDGHLEADNYDLEEYQELDSFEKRRNIREEWNEAPGTRFYEEHPEWRQKQNPTRINSRVQRDTLTHYRTTKKVDITKKHFKEKNKEISLSGQGYHQYHHHGEMKSIKTTQDHHNQQEKWLRVEFLNQKTDPQYYKKGIDFRKKVEFQDQNHQKEQSNWILDDNQAPKISRSVAHDFKKEPILHHQNIAKKVSKRQSRHLVYDVDGISFKGKEFEDFEVQKQKNFEKDFDYKNNKKMLPMRAEGMHDHLNLFQHNKNQFLAQNRAPKGEKILDFSQKFYEKNPEITEIREGRDPEEGTRDALPDQGHQGAPDTSHEPLKRKNQPEMGLVKDQRKSSNNLSINQLEGAEEGTLQHIPSGYQQAPKNREIKNKELMEEKTNRKDNRQQKEEESPERQVFEPKKGFEGQKIEKSQEKQSKEKTEFEPKMSHLEAKGTKRLNLEDLHRFNIGSWKPLIPKNDFIPTPASPKQNIGKSRAGSLGDEAAEEDKTLHSNQNRE